MTPRRGASSAPKLSRYYAVLRARAGASPARSGPSPGSSARGAGAGGRGGGPPPGRRSLRHRIWRKSSGGGGAPAPEEADAPPHAVGSTPPEHLAPLSALELAAPALLRAGGVLVELAGEDTPGQAGAVRRMEGSIRFFLAVLAAGKAPPDGQGRAASAWRKSLEKNSLGHLRRPHHPIVGELAVSWHRLGSDGPLATTVAEQVSYRPPVTAMSVAVPDLDIVFNAVVHPRARLWGTGAQVEMAGERHLVLGGQGERYIFSRSPAFFVPNLLARKFRGEFRGEASVRCAETGLEAVLRFLPGGKQHRHRVEGCIRREGGEVLRELKGAWDQAVVSWSPGGLPSGPIAEEDASVCVGAGSGAGSGGTDADALVLFDFEACMRECRVFEVEVPEGTLLERMPGWALDRPMLSENVWQYVNDAIKRCEESPSGPQRVVSSKKALTRGQRRYWAALQDDGQSHVARFFDRPAEGPAPAKGGEPRLWAPRLSHIAQLAACAGRAG